MYFIKITQDYWTSKNQLQENLKKRIKPFDQLLLDDYKEAVKLIKEAYKKAREESSKRCKEIDFWIDKHKDHNVIIFPSIIHIAIYKVKKYKNDTNQ